MMYRFILMALLGALFLMGCSSEPAQQEAEQQEAAPEQQPAQPQDNTVSYTEQLVAGGLSFKVRTTGQGSQRSLTIVVERPDGQPTQIDEAIEGSVTNSVVTDLNNNTKPELLVFVSGSGSGSYGKVYGYEFEREYWGELTIPALPAELEKDYMGHDEFEIGDNRLVRTFPVYLETDPNCCPTGGKHRITYILDNALNFVVEKVE